MNMKLPIEPPHIGKMLNNYIRRNRYYQSALARDIGVRPETISDFLKRPDNKISNLWKVCFALNYNFLSDLAAKLPPAMPCAPTPKDQRMAELEKQVQELTAECQTLQRVVEALQQK
jgi:DNA-binding XRE family transcriptional regulator